jgi:nicotinate-nucleotide adenylyltransferase
MSGPRIGLYGGTFDPIHHGHLLIARSVREKLDLERVLWIPSAQPPHKPSDGLTSFGHRAAMVKLAIEGEEGFVLDECEQRLGGPSYTLRTIEHCQVQFPDIELCWIIGADSLAELHTWYNVRQLVDACQVVTAHRPGFEQVSTDHLTEVLRRKQIAKLQRGVVDVPRVDISSSHIRERVWQGRSIRYLVPEAVDEYIRDHQLYAASARC